jgi:cytochrome c-type biogenesis protein CcmH/NrfF
MLAFVLALVIGLFAAVPVYAELTNIDLERELLCQCGDCGEVLETCQCDTAGEMRSSIRQMIEEGETEQPILNHFVAQYGEEVLVAPEEEALVIPAKKGLNLGLWVPLSVAMAGGTAALYFILRRWVRKGKAAK